jgi:arylsulfatase A-like enzyme
VVESVFFYRYDIIDNGAITFNIVRKGRQKSKHCRDFVYSYVDEPATLKERYIRQLQVMTGIDRLVGNLRKKLEREGVADNTVIIFTSDHGLFMGEQGLGGKALCYEKNTHVPLIVYDPRQRLKGTSEALVQTIDLAPTMLSLAGIKTPSAMQEEDISPVIYQNKAVKRQQIFTENLWSTHFGNPRCEAVQDQDWKYIRYYKNNNMSATHKVKVAKELKVPVNKML